jgi:MOSC domain-containing protein YiiM
MAGKVVGIFIAGEKEQLPVSVNSIEAIAHRGLVGDRYYANSGTFSGAEPLGPGREITLIEEESVSILSEQLHQTVNPAQLRRNLMTRGIRLNDLVGREFMIGKIRLLGVRLCHPCAHLERLSGWDVMTQLKERGGLRADILDNGWLHLGDTVNVHPDLPSEASL